MGMLPEPIPDEPYEEEQNAKATAVSPLIPKNSLLIRKA